MKRILILLLIANSCYGQAGRIAGCYSQFFENRAGNITDGMSSDEINEYTTRSDSLLVNCLKSCYLENIDLLTIHNKKLGSDYKKDKIFVINFWYTSCTPCIKEFPALNKLSNSYKNKHNVVFVSISFEDSEKVKNSINHWGLNNYWNVVAKETYLTNQIVKFYPTTIVVGYSGKIEGYFVGVPQNRDPSKYIFEEVKSCLEKLVSNN